MAKDPQIMKWTAEREHDAIINVAIQHFTSFISIGGTAQQVVDNYANGVYSAMLLGDPHKAKRFAVMATHIARLYIRTPITSATI